MATNLTQQGMPNAASPLAKTRDGKIEVLIEQIWLQLFIQLWNRTGGAQGGLITDAALLDGLSALPQAPTPALLGLALGEISGAGVDGSIGGTSVRDVAMMALMEALPKPQEAAQSDCCCSCPIVTSVGAAYTITTDDECGTVFIN